MTISLRKIVLLLVVAMANPVFADDYPAQWGPRIGAPLPVLEAPDQEGVVRSFENLVGERGLLLSMNRSADW